MMSTITMLLRSFLSLALVIALAMLITRFLKGRNMGLAFGGSSKSQRNQSVSTLAIEAKVSIAKGHQLVVVNFDGQRILVGQGPAGMTLVSKGFEPVVPAEEPIDLTDNRDHNAEIIDLANVSAPEDLILTQWGKGKFPTLVGAKRTARTSPLFGLKGMLRE